MVEVTKRHDDQFPVGITHRRGIEKFTLKAAKELRAKLSEAIEWAVNMEDIRKEMSLKSNVCLSLFKKSYSTF